MAELNGSRMNQEAELEILASLLAAEPAETEITFREESEREIRYTLVVGTNDNVLLRKLAQIFGCPESGLPRSDEIKFEAADHWHGQGEVDLRELADEFFEIEGEFFDFDITVGRLRSLAGDQSGSSTEL
jgi:hypothetical protein